MPQQGPVVETHHLTKQYGELTALDDLTISIDRGRILGLIGPNGAGKTTTIKILVGFARPTSGTARIAGADCVRDARRIKRLVGYMPDRFGSYDNMRVREYLDFFGAAFGIKRSVRRSRIAEVLEVTNASYMQDRFVESLSHGMQQRVGIARTLLHDPDVLILDEPANGLDPQARIEMRAILLRLAEAGKTLIVTSHILPELSRICHQVAIITNGKLRAFGTLQEITRQINPMRTIELQLTGGDRLSEAADLVRGRLEESAEVTISQAEAIVRFRTGKSEEELSGVLAAIVGSGIPATQFREVQSDLEEAFLTVTRRDAQEREQTTTAAAAVEQPAEDAVAGGAR